MNPKAVLGVILYVAFGSVGLRSAATNVITPEESDTHICGPEIEKDDVTVLDVSTLIHDGDAAAAFVRESTGIENFEILGSEELQAFTAFGSSAGIAAKAAAKRGCPYVLLVTSGTVNLGQVTQLHGNLATGVNAHSIPKNRRTAQVIYIREAKTVE